VRVYNPSLDLYGSAIWSGFATREKIDWWLQVSQGLLVNVLADQFLEQDHIFQIPGGQLQALGIKRDVRVSGKLIGPRGSVKLITRATMSDWERHIHSRWPIPTSGIYEFSYHDLTQFRQLELGI